MSPSLWLVAMVLAMGAGAFLFVFYGTDLVVAAVLAKWQIYADWCTGELKALHVRMSPLEFFARHMAVTFGLAGFAYLVSTPSKTVIAALLGLFSPPLWFKLQKEKRQKLLNEQLDPGLQLMGNAVLATQNLVDGFDALAKHGTPPLSEEAALLIKELRVGNTLDQAMHNLSVRCQNRNVDTVVTALAIGRRTGGNLPKVLDIIARVLRETLRVEGLMASKTAEGKASGFVMAGLPVFFMIVMSVVDPDWMSPLYNDVLGNVILAVVIGLTLAGGMLIRKVSTIDV